MNGRQRPLTGREYVYVRADGVYCNARLDGEKLCLLVIIGVTADGKKELVAVNQGVRESEQSWLVIDEVGYCNFVTENTSLFLDMIDRRYNKEGNFNIIFTSIKQPKFWKQCFAEEDTLKCAMDRIFDDVMLFNFSGSSHRGQNREAFNLTTKKVQTVTDSIQEIE